MGDSEFARVGAMATQVSYLRNPYPLPDLSAEGDWVPRGPALGDKVSLADRDWDIGLNTHERLFAHHTLNSTRKHKYLRRPKEPKDSLDLALSAIYVHNEDTLVPKSYVPMQPETLGRKTWRVLRNETFIGATHKSASHPGRMDGPLRRVIDRVDHRTRSAPAWMSSSRERSRCNQVPIVAPQAHPSSVKLSIEGPHVDQSNPGYSRKVDGTFYSI